MKELSTLELRGHIERLYSRLKPLTVQDGVYKPLDDFWGNGTPNGQDGGFCYSDEQGYHYGVNERGKLITNVVTRSLEEISYHVMSSDILNMAGIYEAKNRIEGQDFRRLWFKKILEYWSAIGEKYVRMAEQKLQQALAKAPFVD
ncbi:MAG: Imm63 family immunity protein [Balneolaceae bacterium]